MRKLMALFTACLMAAAMMVPAFAADLEDALEVVIIDGEEELKPRNADLCDCGGALRVISRSEDPPRAKAGGQKYPTRLCSHNNPNHVVVDREQTIEITYRCDRCDRRVITRRVVNLTPDCIN